MMKSLFKENAFSLAEVLIAAGLLGVISLGGLQVFEQIHRAETRGRNLNDLINFNSAFERYVYGPTICDEIRDQTFSTTYADISFSRWNYAGVGTIVSGTKIESLNLTSFQAKIDLSNTLPKIVVSGASYIKTMLNIMLSVKSGKRTNSYYYNIPVLATDIGVVKYCKETKNAVEICNSMLGEFDSVTGRCRHSNSCLLRGTYMSIQCSPSNYGCSPLYGASTVNPLTGASNCPSGSIGVTSGDMTWNHTVPCGKKCTQGIRNNVRWITCLECP